MVHRVWFKLMKKQIALIDSVCFDILLQQKVRQEGLSETHARG